MLLLVCAGSSMDARAEPSPAARALAVGWRCRALERWQVLSDWPQHSTPMEVALAMRWGHGALAWVGRATAPEKTVLPLVYSNRELLNGEAPLLRAGWRGVLSASY